VMLHWLDRGAAGWRLDAAYAVPPRAWSEVTRRVRAKYPDAWLVGEVIHGDYGAYVNEGGLSSVTQYELWKAIWSSLNDRNFYELAWTLDRHNSLLESFAPMTFLGNHDVTRLASQLVDERHLAHALVVLLTVGGVPSIYYGDERAYRGLKEDRPGGDDAVRPIFPDSPSGVTNEGSGYVRLHQLLIGLRRRHPWLVRARTTVLALANTSLSYTVSDRTNSDQLCVALNVGPGAAALTMPPGKWRCVAGKGQAQEGVAHLASEDWAIFAEGTEP
jgi:glycosidase